MTVFTALGDSITVGMGDPVGGGWRGWAALLGGSLDQPEIYNLATLGALAVDVERHQLPAAVALAPDVASVIVGINDTLRGDFDPERTGASIGRTVAALRGRRRGSAHHPAARSGPDVRAAGGARPAAGPPDASGQHGRGSGGTALRDRAPGRRPGSGYLRAPLLERRPAAP
jgi:lysophospholipase L1-like esterase